MSAVDDQLATNNVPVAYFGEFDFASGMIRLTTWGTNITWGGHTWFGLGSLVGISKVAASERPQYPALDFSLGIANPALLIAARGNVENYRGRDATLYRYILSPAGGYLGDPELIWAGEMSQVRIDSGDGTERQASITLRCEQRGRAQRNSESLRLVSAQHELRFPGDTAFRRKEELIGKPQLWLSKRFQQV